MGGRPELASPIQELMSEVSLYPHGPSYMPPQRLWLSLEGADRRGKRFITANTATMNAPAPRLCVSTDNKSGQVSLRMCENGRHERSGGTEAVSEYGRHERSGGTEACMQPPNSYGSAWNGGKTFITMKTGHYECTRTETVSEYGRQEMSGGHLASRPLRASFIFFFFFITLGLEMSDTQVYEP